MLVEISAGGVVNFANTILLLKKFNGDWVLPKGRLKVGESKEEAALREVFEESGIRGEIITYLGEARYNYKNMVSRKSIDKTVHWYLMKCYKMNCIPQKTEGFIEGVFVHYNKAVEIVKYRDEKNMILKAIDLLNLEGEYK